MAIRPVFLVNEKQPYYKEIATEFKFFPGFSEAQRRRSSISLQNSFLLSHSGFNILEVSSVSNNALGQQLSAFNLKFTLNERLCTVESAFQSSKKFETGGPYKDLLFAPSYKAKKDERIKTSGNLVGFVFEEVEFPLEPKTYFYDWLYINALRSNKELANEVIKYNSFTDIVFNPKKSFNCQARSCAIFVSLYNNSLLEKALKSKESFLEVIYKKNSEKNNQENGNCEQISLF